MSEPQKILQVRVVELAREGDEKAFEDLYNKYQLRIYEYLAGLVGRSDADDLMQETFIKALTKVSTLQDASKFEPWLYRIARNCANDHLRHKYRYRFQSIEDVLKTDAIVDDVDLAENLDQRERVWRALAHLPLKLRDCLLLNVIGGLSSREISPIVGLNERSVNTYLSNARRLFRETYLFLQRQSDVTEREVKADGEY